MTIQSAYPCMARTSLHTKMNFYFTSTSSRGNSAIYTGIESKTNKFLAWRLPRAPQPGATFNPIMLFFYCAAVKPRRAARSGWTARKNLHIIDLPTVCLWFDLSSILCTDSVEYPISKKWGWVCNSWTGCRETVQLWIWYWIDYLIETACNDKP